MNLVDLTGEALNLLIELAIHFVFGPFAPLLVQFFELSVNGSNDIDVFQLICACYLLESLLQFIYCFVHLFEFLIELTLGFVFFKDSSLHFQIFELSLQLRAITLLI